MALADIVINDGQSTPVAHTFSFTGTSGNRVIRSDFSANPEVPRSLTIEHREAKKSGATVKSHLYRVDVQALDADSVTTYAANIRLMADVPNPILSDALAADLAAYIRNWATAVNITAWLRGSVF